VVLPLSQSPRISSIYSHGDETCQPAHATR
jgi:hypothetical protein